ncbi:hypothetical protein [Actinacidiphila epipremni]|uniref:Glycoside hydrolase family 42 N-terminal domain-containing protein n=1 Tax=Actinacidiphila epipremni TaxID=2053013 RepID=A0ABX0ZVG7_9ACTN|nr:hypothetical protein [Actinacidiphila epipremni]NJP45473.1 hypothetical protein [Actinacidiphila epipremni]
MTEHQSLSRRRMLLAAGGAAALPGTGLAVLAASGTARAQAAPAGERAAVPPTADLPLIGGTDFPIGAFWPPPPTQITVERYQEIADAGFTFLHNGNYLWDATGIRYALGIAQQVGLKMLIAGDPLEASLTGNFWIEDDPSGNRPQVSPSDAEVSLRAVLSTYQGYTSFAGLNLVDEPAANRFTTLAALVDTVRRISPTALPYINFRRLGQPYGAWGTPGMDAATYARYVQEGLDAITPSLLCYDRYPLYPDGADDPDYFQNWAIVRDAGLRAGIPTWIYIQSLQYAGHRLPTAAELAWQVNISLAYGAKGVQYFTYWTPDPSRGTGFVPAQGLLTVAGERTPLYDAAKQLNTGWLRPAGRELKPLVSESVVHAGDTPLPAGATAFAPDERIAAVAGGPVVLGTFAAPAPGDPATRWLLVANRSHDAAVTARIALRPHAVAGVARFDPATAAYEPPRRLPFFSVSLPAGGAALYRLTGH